MIKKGFTLVEVVISLALFAVLAYAGTTFFIQAVRDSSKVAIENEVRETAAVIMADVSNEIKALANQTNNGRYCVANSLDNLNVYFSDGPPSDYTNNCATPNSYTRRIIYTTNLVTGSFTKRVITTSPASDVSSVLNSTKTFVVDCGIGTGGCSLNSGCTSGFKVTFPAQSLDTTPAITINLSVQQASSITRSDYCARTKVVQTVTPRLRP